MLANYRKILIFLCLSALLISSYSPVMMNQSNNAPQNSATAPMKTQSASGGIHNNVYTPIIGRPGHINATLFVHNNTISPGLQNPSSVAVATPVASVYDSSNGYVYVLNYNSGNISIFDPLTDHLIGSISGLSNPFDGIYNPSNGYIYVAGSSGVSVINPGTSTVISTIACGNLNSYIGNGNTVSTISYDSRNSTIFVANMYSHNVSVISSTTNTVVETFNFTNASAEPNAVAYDPSNNMVYITDYYLHLLYIYNGTTYTQVTNITLPGNTDGASVFYDPAGNSILIGTQTYLILYILNTASNAFSSISTPGTPYSMQYDPANNTMLISLYGGRVVQVLDSANRIAGNITVNQTGQSFTFAGLRTQYMLFDLNTYNAVSVFNASTGSFVNEFLFTAQPSASAYDPATKNLYVTDSASNAVYVINSTTNQTVKTIFLPENPGAIIYDPGNGMIYAAGNYMTEIDPLTNTIVSSIYLPRLPSVVAMTYDPATELIYTANDGNFSISAFNTSSGTFPFTYHMTYSSFPSGIVYDPADGYIYTDGFIDNTIYILSPSNLALVTTIYLGSGSFPAQAAYDALTGEVYFCSEANGKLFVVAGTGVAAVVTSVGGTTSAMFNPSNNLMYVSGNTLINGNASLYVINAYTNNVISTITIGNFLGSLTYSEASKTLYATDQVGLGIYLIDGFAPTNYTVYFNETGLPAGTQWYVNLSTGSSLSGTGSTHSLGMPNGTYYYTISSANRNYGAPGGSIFITAANLDVGVAFSSTKYAVTFNATGLPSGSLWWANVTGHAAASTTSGKITFSLVDGSYSYNLSSENKTYAPSTVSGTFSVDNRNLELNVSFQEVTYFITFALLGLPYGDLAFVNLSNGISVNSTTLTMGTTLPNGTYSYTAQTPYKNYRARSGQFTVDGIYTTTIAIFFSAVLFEVNFTETGLPAGTQWYVNISNQSGPGFGSGPIYNNHYSTNITNGSYSYAAASTNATLVAGYGSFTINGAPKNIPVSFAKAKYLVTFSEQNLPSGTLWYINLSSGQKLSSSSQYIETNLTIGSYTYSVATANKTFSAPAGSFSVVKGGTALNVVFSPVTYSVTFSETGLPAGSSWYVNSTGHYSGPVTASSFAVSLVNGSYNATASTSNPGYVAQNPVITFTVSGSSVSESITFTSAVSVVTFSESGLAGGILWYVNLSNGMDLFTGGNGFSVKLADGSYSYTIQTANKVWSILPSSGSFTLTGAPLTVNAVFSKTTYSVDFSETNVSFSSTWFVNITGQSPLTGTGHTDLTINLPNGTYSYIVSTSDKTWVSTVRSGTFQISGSGKIIDVTFQAVTYSVNFTESGLPSGTLWYVNLTSGKSLSSTTSTITASLQNGSYTYSVATADKIFNSTAGAFTVSGATPNVIVTFTAVTYKISFNETGMPSTDTWYVVISGSLLFYPSNGTLGLHNGTYSYSVHSSDRTYSSHGGTFTVNGNSVDINISFSRVTYVLYFNETGLPTGTNWSVTFNGSTKSSSSSTISFLVINGTYSYTIAKETGYYSNGQSSGSYSISGQPSVFSVYFNAYSYVTGTVNPPNATVSVNGISEPLTTGHFNFTVKSGTVHVVVTDKGYSTYYLNFSINSGQVKNLTISLSSVSTPPVSKNPSIPWTYLFIAIIVIGAVVAVVLAMRGKKS